VSKSKCVTYRDNWFWAYDPLVGVFLKQVIDVAEASPQAKTPWLTQRIQWWRVVACVLDYGLQFEDDWTAEQLEVFVQFAEGACAEIAKREWISGEEMRSWQILDGEGVFARGDGVMTGPVVELGRAVIALIRGELPSPPRGKRWFYGPEGRDEWETRE
jgi:hypothetical protein